jgi:hypothetical protein
MCLDEFEEDWKMTLGTESLTVSTRIYESFEMVSGVLAVFQRNREQLF